MTQGMKMITDESTDISLLGAIVLCYSGRGGQVVSTFLDLKEIESGTVVTMAKVIKDLIISVQSDSMKLMIVVVVCGFFKIEFYLHHLVKVRLSRTVCK